MKREFSAFKNNLYICSLLILISFLIQTSMAFARSKMLIFSTHEMPGSIWQTEVFEPWFAEIEKRTGGKVKIQTHYGGELVNFSDSFDAVVRGVVDIAEYCPHMSPGKFPLDDISSFYPYGSNFWKSSNIYWDLYHKYPQMRKPHEDAKLITMMVLVMRGIGSTSKPILGMADMKGVKFISPGKWAGLRFEALGAIPVTIPPQDAFLSLQTGTVDAAIPVMMQLRDFKYGEVLKNFTKVNSFGVPFCIAMNKRTWNSLSPDIQAVFEEMGAGFIERSNLIFRRLEAEREMQAKKDYPSLTFVDLPRDEMDRWNKLNDDVLKEYADYLNSKGLPGTTFTNDFLSLYKKYANE